LTGTKREVPTLDAVQDDLIPTSEQRSLRKDWSDMNQTVEERSALPKVEEKLFTAQERARAETEKNQEVPVSEATPLDREMSEAKPATDTADEALQMKASDYRLLGVLGKLYVLLESAEGLVLMDQHAAHERVLFEEMKRRMESEEIPSQSLLSPIMVDLTPRDFDLIEKNLDVINKLGLSAEPFGGSTLKIDSLPSFLKSDDPEGFLQELIDEIRASSERMSKLRLGEDMIATTVCRHAVKANDLLHDRELQKLLEDLLECDMPYCCPHGRPTLIQISFAELERKFGRRT
jgi:DNA mismatch repair protein MutL